MSGRQEPGSGARIALDTLDLAVKGARAYGREDLVERLAGARGLLTEPDVTVYVVGEFKQGKSSLVNALLTAKICPVDDDIATAVPTVVRYAAESAVTATYEPADTSAPAWTERIRLEDLPAHVSEAGNPGNVRKLRSVTASISRQLLSGGLVLVDTPGVGGLGSPHHAVTVSSLPRAHAVLFLSDASRELTAAELRFLRIVRELCPAVVFVLTKVDLYPQWRRILELDAGHLAASGIEVDIIAVSSELRTVAARSADQEMNVESGFPVLVRRLQGVVGDAERASLHAIGLHVGSAVGQLEAALKARRRALIHPESSKELVAELTRVNDRVDALRSQSARWQQILFDGFADISSDVDYDLRARARAVLHEAEESIEDGDPAKNWPEFEKWLRQRLSTETMENYAGFVTRVRELGVRVADHFELAETQAVVPREVQAPVRVLEEIAIDSSFTTTKARGTTGMAAFQKAYSGFLMFSMLTKMAALALPTPFGVAAGLLMGRSGFLDERKRQLEKRRTLAKNAVRRFVDEFNLQVGKDSRDAMRTVQRELRDAYSGRVEELQRSLSEALMAAKKAVADDDAESGELDRLKNDLDALEVLGRRAGELTSRSAPRAIEAVA